MTDNLVGMHGFTQSTPQRPDLQGGLSDSGGQRIFHKIEGVHDFGFVGGFLVLLNATYVSGGLGGTQNVVFYSVSFKFFYLIPPTNG